MNEHQEPKMWLATDDDGRQMLVTEWSDGHVEIARRDEQGAVWGPPLAAEVVEL